MTAAMLRPAFAFARRAVLVVAISALWGCAGTEVSKSTQYFVNKDFTAARVAVQTALKHDPHNEEALALAGWSAFMLDSFAEAQSYFRRLLRQNPRHFDALLGMAWTNIKTGDYDVADEYLAQAADNLQFDWQRRFLPDARGWIALRRGDLDGAEAHFREEFQLKVESWDRAADALVGLGWVALKRGNLDRARTMFARGLDDSDKCFYCHDGLARIALDQGDAEGVVRHALAGLAIAPSKQDLIGLLEDGLARLGDPARRIAAYEKLAARHADSALFQARLGQAYESAGRLAEARAAYEHALRLDPDQTAAKAGLESIARRAAAPAQRPVISRQMRRPVGLLHMAALRPPASVETPAARLRLQASIALYNQGWAMIDAGRLDEAERAFRAASTQVPEMLRWTVDDGIGWVAYYRRDYDAAHAQFTKVLQVRPDAYLSRKGLGFVALERKAYDEAVKHIVASLSQNPYQVPLSFTIPATRLLDAKKFEHARQILELGEWSYPRAAEIQFLLARAFVGLNERKKGIEKAILAASLDPMRSHLVFDDFPISGRDMADAYRTMAWGLYFAGDAAGAYRRFDQYLQGGGDDPDGLRGRGFALFRLGRYEEAIADLQKATQFEPERLAPVSEEIPIPGSNLRAQVTYSAHSTLAWAYFRLNRAPKAELEFRKVLKQNPFWVDTLTGLGYSLLAQNDRDGAARSFREALRISPGYFDARRGLTLAEAGGEAAPQPGRASAAPGTRP